MLVPQDTLYVVLSVSVGLVAVFLCWALYEIAMFVRTSNQIVADVQLRITQLEQAAGSLKEKFINPLNYLSLLTGGSKALYSVVKGRKEKKASKVKRNKKSELFDEE